MGLVSQEPVLFNDTIRANIMYGKEAGEATEAEIIAATKLANAHKFISGLQQVISSWNIYKYLTVTSIVVSRSRNT